MKLKTMFKKKLNINIVAPSVEVYSTKRNLDELWDIISGCIIKYAYKTLSSKETKIGIHLPKDLSNSAKILKDLRLLGKLYHIYTKNYDSIIEDKVRQV